MKEWLRKIYTEALHTYNYPEPQYTHHKELWIAFYTDLESLEFLPFPGLFDFLYSESQSASFLYPPEYPYHYTIKSPL